MLVSGLCPSRGEFVVNVSDARSAGSDVTNCDVSVAGDELALRENRANSLANEHRDFESTRLSL